MPTQGYMWDMVRDELLLKLGNEVRQEVFVNFANVTEQIGRLDSGSDVGLSTAGIKKNNEEKDIFD